MTEGRFANHSVLSNCSLREGNEDGEAMIKRQTRASQSELKLCDFKEGVKAPNDMDCFSFMSVRKKN